MYKWRYGYAKNDQSAKDLEKEYDNRIKEHNLLSQTDKEFADDYYERYPFIRRQAIEFAEEELHIVAEHCRLNMEDKND